ncbi:DUF2969 family protein [Lactobacillus sp. S2-2]|uniref:DUF2969 family protein n=1 Tax=Lactobacillus sp. S2-2 TaxID=2692917 RepID=UPI001F40CBDA|nr:DUF2969 family protein [Lactobacillus sp. S2-2]MCF6515776.1 DUF2969 family protein [Lactobacillus sp. S2-2]
MSKKEKQINVEIIDEKNSIKNVQINKEIVGSIINENDKFIAKINDDLNYTFKNESDALEQIIKEYNLHQN